MADLKTIREGITNWLFLNDSLDRLEEDGVSVRSESSQAQVSDINVDDFSPRIHFQASQMREIYVGFFCLENAARELITQRLSERHSTSWWTSKVPNKIRDSVESLKKKEEKNKYLSNRSVSEIGYTFFGNLCKIIIANWDDFNDLFPDQAWITSRFNDLEACRNIIMHTNVLPQEEIDRINGIIRDWLSQVG